ncbi:MAG TPA: hypothetical protein ENO14_03030 [Chromatiales bacterium]|nr:hypothetical protein [Chromatiales bacterium]
MTPGRIAIEHEGITHELGAIHTAYLNHHTGTLGVLVGAGYDRSRNPVVYLEDEDWTLHTVQWPSHSWTALTAENIEGAPL